MAAFPGYQDNNMNHFLADSVYLKIMSGIMEDGTMNSNCLCPPLAEPILHETTPCLDHRSKVALSPHDDKEPSVVDKVENGHQKVSPIDKKRKTKNGSGSGSSSISVQSKDGRERKGKKQKQCNGEGKEKQKPKGEHQEPLTGYIHVRARRGQATDSHSLAERVRREKISEKMKTLQRLVPGCDKVSGKALMLDEIISYVQSLQNQVEFLSMKIASVNPMFFDLSLEQEQDSFIFNLEERLNSMHASPLPQCSPNQPTVFADTPTNIISNTYNTPLDTSTFSQGNANLLWDVEEQVSQTIWIQ